jgi:hypothetical protein
MNKAKLKSYAPQARLDFIAAVTARANLLGLSAKAGQLDVAPAQTQGDVTIIAGQAWPSNVNGQRERLIDRMKRDGFEQTCEAIAYTWFNRFAALRYMELHDYLGHGYRALSSASGALPDILTYAADLANAGQSGLPGLKAEVVTEMKLAGNRDGELYRMLLVAQCNALSRAMPFLFERIDDDSELLLPDNLLRSDSVIAKLVEEIPEENWAEVEIIGWLYQFYISEKKDQVIGKVVKSEDIPAATQLFTPNWIVQYLVQNSVGRLWLMANPQSNLAKEWPYYITPAEQTPEVQAQLDALIQTRIREDGDTLNPESITVLDPACGSGHILVVAYDVLKAIYLERGYQPRAIPRLILEKNLYGLDIDDRAAQMAGFALLMRARADDRRLLTSTDDAGNLEPPKLNVLSLQESKGLSVDELAKHLAPFQVQHATIAALLDTFENAKTFGSLIQIPYVLKVHLALLPEILTQVQMEGDMYASAAATDLLPLVQQAELLEMQYDAVIANPPYMGIKFFSERLKRFIEDIYAESKGDLYASFIVKCSMLTKKSGLVGMITIPNWMFLTSYQKLRSWLFSENHIESICHNGRGVFGSDFGSCAFTFQRGISDDFVGTYKRLFTKQGEVSSNEELCSLFNEKSVDSFASASDFLSIPGLPVAYWVSKNVRGAFKKYKPLKDYVDPRKGLTTGDNESFIRLWHEVPMQKTTIFSGEKWFPMTKGGQFRKWYGNNEYIIDWDSDGERLKNFAGSVIRNERYYLSQGGAWNDVSISSFSIRFLPAGYINNAVGPVMYEIEKGALLPVIALLNSNVGRVFFQLLCPTMKFEIGDVAKFPIADELFENIEISENARRCIEIAKHDWNDYENSWEFKESPLINQSGSSLGSAFANFEATKVTSFDTCLQLEQINNKILIETYGLQEELSSEVLESQITLARADREKDCQRLISYAIGCMMGRYSLDEPGLIYANAGNVGFEPGRYTTFPADADGIVPITDELWFEDDAILRTREFLLAVWGVDTLEENLSWLAESLGSKATETPEEAIRRYVADKFFKDHLQTYKKRPIYWLFSSGKQGAFQALVYLHRYHEGTLSRMRAEYVVPLTSKIQSRIEMLQKDMASASSTAARNKLAKEVEKLKKKHVELLAYDEQLRHYADMRIKLDLDDGVKVNYGKFGDLLAEVKAVTGGTSDD